MAGALAIMTGGRGRTNEWKVPREEKEDTIGKKGATACSSHHLTEYCRQIMSKRPHVHYFLSGCSGCSGRGTYGLASICWLCLALTQSNSQFDKLHVAPSRVGTIHARRISVAVVKFDREARTLPYYPPSLIGKRPPQIKGQAPAGTVSNPCRARAFPALRPFPWPLPRRLGGSDGCQALFSVRSALGILSRSPLKRVAPLVFSKVWYGRRVS